MRILIKHPLFAQLRNSIGLALSTIKVVNDKEYARLLGLNLVGIATSQATKHIQDFINLPLDKNASMVMKNDQNILSIFIRESYIQQILSTTKSEQTAKVVLWMLLCDQMAHHIKATKTVPLTTLTDSELSLLWRGHYTREKYIESVNVSWLTLNPNALTANDISIRFEGFRDFAIATKTGESFPYSIVSGSSEKLRASIIGVLLYSVLHALNVVKETRPANQLNNGIVYLLELYAHDQSSMQAEFHAIRFINEWLFPGKNPVILEIANDQLPDIVSLVITLATKTTLDAFTMWTDQQVKSFNDNTVSLSRHIKGMFPTGNI